MKSLLFAAATAALVATSASNAALVYGGGTETGSRFNAGAGAITYMNCFTAVSAGQTQLAVDSAIVGIRRLVVAGALTDVGIKIYAAEMTYDGTNFGRGANYEIYSSASLGAGTASVTQLVNTGAVSGVTLNLETVSNAGLGGWWIGVEFTGANAANTANGWRVVNAPTTGASIRTEIDRTERFFKRSMQGVRNAWRVLAMRSEVTVQPITPAINTMAMPEMHETTTREIAAAFGIPLSLLTSDSANYATAQSDMRLFYENTIKARLMMYEAALNEQVLGAMGLHIKFTPEALAIYQEDEAERSGALLNLVNAGIPLNNAMLILGYAVEDVTGMTTQLETVTTSGAVVAVDAAPKALLMPTDPPMEDQPIDEDDYLPEVQTHTRSVAVDDYAARAHNDAMALELKAWAKVAGKDLARALEFKCDHIVPEWEAWIKAQLAEPGVDVAHVMAHMPTKTVTLRTKGEKAVAKRVTAVFNKFGTEIKAQAAKGVVDYDTTDKMFKALGKSLTPVLENIFKVQARGVLAVSTAEIPEESFTTAAFDWAEKEAGYTLPREMNETTLKNLRRVALSIGQDPSLSAAEITAALYPTFSPYRAAMTAVTEVTRAKAAANNECYDILTEYGEDVVRRWSTYMDERVCPICRPLDNKKEKIYAVQFKSGPPAHPNCRCRIGVEVSGITSDVGEFD